MNTLEQVGVIILAVGAALLVVAGRYSGDATIAGAGFVPRWLARFVFGERKHS